MTSTPMKITYQPIGIVHTPFTSTEGIPIQPSRSDGALGWLEVFPAYVDGLRDLEGFSHIVLLTHLHQSRPHRLSVVPFLDDQPRGLFATRAPSRPNPIGLSVVRLKTIEGARVSIQDIDLLDGTPLLDIKPYVPEFDIGHEVRLGWLDQALRRRSPSDSRFDR